MTCKHEKDTSGYVTLEGLMGELYSEYVESTESTLVSIGEFHDRCTQCGAVLDYQGRLAPNGMQSVEYLKRQEKLVAVEIQNALADLCEFPQSIDEQIAAMERGIKTLYEKIAVNNECPIKVVAVTTDRETRTVTATLEMPLRLALEHGLLGDDHG